MSADAAYSVRRPPAWLIWSAVALQVALEATYLLLGQLLRASGHAWSEDNGLVGDLAFALSTLSIPAVGVLIFSRRPEHPIGWLFCVTNLGWALNNAAGAYVRYAVLGPGSELPGVAAMAWLYNWPGSLSMGLLVLLVLLFPNGRLASPRWRPFAGLVVAGSGLAAVASMFAPGPVDATLGVAVANPFGIEGPIGEVLRQVSRLSMGLGVLLFGGAVLSLVLRLRRASGVERQQLKWFAYAVGLVLAIFAGTTAIYGTFETPDAMPAWAQAYVYFGILASELVPATAVGIAILRYRLYEIDVLIRRTLVYGALTAGLGLTYWGSVLLLQTLLRPLTAGSDLAIVASTLAVAALFQPLRGRIQALVDRRFYRARYDARQTLEQFSSRLREQVDLDGLSAELVGVVHRTIQPAHASLWLRPPNSGQSSLFVTAPVTFPERSGSRKDPL